MEFRPRLKIYKGSNGKNTFNPESNEFRSYEHWVYACKVKGVWVFNNYRYSVTTSGHQSEGRCFLRDELKVRDADIVHTNQRQSLKHGLKLDDAYENIYLLEYKLKTERREKNKSEIIETLSALRANLARLKKLGAKASEPVADIKKRVIETEIQRRETARVKNRDARIAYVAKRKALELEHGAKLTDVSEVSI